MTEPFKVEARVVRQVYLWFLPYEPTDPEVIAADYDSEDLKVSLGHSFDYERLAKEEWRLHLDIDFNVVPLAKIKTRTIIEIKCPKERLFHADALTPLNKIALESAQRGFFEQCKAHGIDANFSKIANVDERAKDFAPHMIEQFHIRQRDAMTLPKWNEGGLTFTPGNKTLLTTQSTFIILDQVLHSNKLFDLKHNQEVFHAVVPEPVYYTIKMICMELLKGNIRLVFMHNVLFQICLDCAIQLMLDRHAGTLQPAIIHVGLTPEKQKLFVEYGSAMLRKFREELKKGGSRITNLEERRDWNSLIM
jgi:hypothetical protein